MTHKHLNKLTAIMHFSGNYKCSQFTSGFEFINCNCML